MPYNEIYQDPYANNINNEIICNSTLLKKIIETDSYIRHIAIFGISNIQKSKDLHIFRTRQYIQS